MIIAVDFDGCLASAGTWPEVGEPNEALINWLICLRKRGDKVILWTCRADEALQKAVEFCKVHGLELYIDDKALKVEFPERTNDE